MSDATDDYYTAYTAGNRGSGATAAWDWPARDRDSRRRENIYSHGPWDTDLTDDVYWLKPTPPNPGMTPRELADYQRDFTTFARGRLLGTGAQQYASEQGQKFETLDVAQLISETQEELADVVNYAAMISIQLERIKEKLNG